MQLVIIAIFALQAIANLLAVLGPELGFDALFYHLTLPKLFLLQERWYYPGLLHISAMPRLAETLFIPALKFAGTLGPKLIQFFSGLISAFLTYRLSKKFLSSKYAALATLLFYNSWLVSWQSGSGYIDLIRTAFELFALYVLIAKPEFKLFHIKLPAWLLSGIFYGLAVGTKWHALVSLVLAGLIFNPLIIPIALLVASPWFYLAFHFTGNPVYPLLETSTTQTQLAQVSSSFYAPLQALKRLLKTPILIGKPYDTLINPLLTFLFPLGLFKTFKSNPQLKKISLFTLGSVIIWQLTPPPSGRYLLPALPLIALISIHTLKISRFNISRLSYLLIIATTLLIALGRLVVNSKFIPIITNTQTQNQFLTSQNSRLPDTYIDSDGWIAQNIHPDNKVLVKNLHNLYYLPFDFDHYSWASDTYPYSYQISQRQNPDQINGQLLHTNSLGIQVFKLESSNQ